MEQTLLSTLFFKRFFHLPVSRTLFHIFPFIIKGFPLGQTDSCLYLTILQVNFQRNQGVASFIGFSREAADFLLVQQEFAHPFRLMVELMRLGVGTDMRMV